MSLYATVAAVSFLFSSAHCWIAPSTCRRLLMQAFFCEVVRARMKLGIAIAARRPIMATTIIISTNVKPDLREVLMFILLFVSLFCGVNVAAGGLVLFRLPFTHCLLRPHCLGKQPECHANRGTDTHACASFTQLS